VDDPKPPRIRGFFAGYEPLAPLDKGNFLSPTP
jgi:hypothetical protein